MPQSLLTRLSKTIHSWLRFIPKPCLIVGLLVFSAEAHASFAPEKIWLNHFRLGDLAAAEDGQWTITAKGTDTVFFALNTVWPLPQPMRLSIPPDVTAATCRNLREKGIRIGIECGYMDHPIQLLEPSNPASDALPSREMPKMGKGIGRITARAEIAKLRPIWQAGDAPDFLVLDDPMRRLLIPGQDVLGQCVPGMPSIEAAAAEVVGYMQTMREKFPRVQFVIILNFPNWGWRGQPAYTVAPNRPSPLNWGDAAVVLDGLYAAVDEAQLSIHALQGDFPWRYFSEAPISAIAATVDWQQRLLELEAYARARGSRFHLVSNSETGYLSAEAFAKDSLSYLDAYLAAGGKPDHFVVQSWYPHPKNLLPENDSDAATWLAARFIERQAEIRNGSEPRGISVKKQAFNRSEPEALLALLNAIAPDRWAELSPLLGKNWLAQTYEPNLTEAAESLKSLRTTVDEAMASLPKVVLVMSDREVIIGRGQAPIAVTAEPSQVWILEIISQAPVSHQVSAWVEGDASPIMKPVWISPSTSGKIAVRFQPEMIRESALHLQIGIEDGEVFKIALPVVEKSLAPSKP